MIRLRGVRHNNLKNFDLDLPLNQLIVITGLSGSGKSSLAFDTLFAEGQRRYIETFSPYARQFFDRMDKPRVDSVEGIPPAIAIEQRNAVKTTRSTVGTMTEICDHMKTLWPQIAQLHCRNCGRPVRKDSPQRIWEAVQQSDFRTSNSEAIVSFELPLAEKLSLEESIGLVTKQGYQRLLVPGRGDGGQTSPLPPLVLNEASAPWGKTQSKQPSTAARGADFEIVRADEAVKRLNEIHPKFLTVVQDRIKVAPENRSRFVEACEQAYHFGKGKLAVHFPGGDAASSLQPLIRSTNRFSNRFHCAQCDIEYREPSTALFSFNHPLGACPACRGFGRIISIDYNLALPDRSKTLAEGVVKPWLGGQGVECQRDLMKFCKIRKAPTDVPFERLPKKWQDWVILGDPDYGKGPDHEWPRAWYGVKGYFRWLESKAYKMHVRVLLSRYRAYTPCPDCQGKRFQPEALLYKMTIRDLRFTRGHLEAGAGTEQDASIADRNSQISLADFYQLPVRDALRFIERVASWHQAKPSDPIGLVLGEVRSRLGYLVDVGLGYLTLDRPTRTLSGGETERVNLTTCLGTRLVNTLYVLDEPSVGLHPRDTGRLIRILEHLRDLGNTVVVVEHEASVIRAADRIVDLGPGHGESGGQLVFQGTYEQILRSEESLTGQYLSGRKRVESPQGRPDAYPTLTLAGATLHNLKNITVQIPLGRFVCITGVSGSGKTTLVREVLLPALEARLRSRMAEAKLVAKASDRIEDDNDDEDEAEPTNNQRSSTHITGWEHLGRAVLVDQSPLGKTPRSNPAVYIGAFDDIRELFAQTDAARQRGLNSSAFSFNSTQGQCERCRGAGFEKIEMQFLSDVFIRCPDCNGRRYRPHILEVKVSSSRRMEAPFSHSEAGKRRKMRKSQSLLTSAATQGWSIADLLDATVDEAIGLLNGFRDSRSAQRAVEKLMLLTEVGLGYLRLGQPINTLSGGESQRLKLVSHLAEAVAADARRLTSKPEIDETLATRPTFFLFDEPTTGLHFDDIRVLLKAFQRLVDAGHSVLVIEHNLDVIKCADWIIDLGPDAGDEGGHIVAEGTPEEVAACPASHTGRFLREVLSIPSTRTGKAIEHEAVYEHR
jgi:excinuclease ABC subunit A